VAWRGRLKAPYRRWRFHEFGKGAVIDRPEWIYGPGHISIGQRVLILRGAWLAVERMAWGRPAPVLSIGAGTGIRPHCTISAAESVVIEEDVIFGAFCSVVDNDHSHRGGDENVGFNQAFETTPVRIGRGTWIADRVAVLRGSDIGRYCVIGANSVVRGTIPDYSIAVGAPARVVGTTRPAEDAGSS
jgi:acetyltransferase-like isoleucine patch superfamily enzyme